MTSLTIYIAGPIDGVENRNEKAFRTAADFVRRRGHVPVVPLDIDAWPHGGDCPRGYTTGEGHSSACWIRGDLVTLLTECDAIYLMRGWEYSRGGTLEWNVATYSGLKVFYETTGPVVPYVRRKMSRVLSAEDMMAVENDGSDAA